MWMWRWLYIKIYLWENSFDKCNIAVLPSICLGVIESMGLGGGAGCSGGFEAPPPLVLSAILETLPWKYLSSISDTQTGKSDFANWCIVQHVKRRYIPARSCSILRKNVLLVLRPQCTVEQCSISMNAIQSY